MNTPATFNHTRLLLPFLLLVGLSISSYAQDWTSPLAGNRNPNFYAVQENFNTYWANKNQKTTKGWKAYKRWEHFWEPRVARDGSFPAFNIVEKEWNAYKATHSALAPVGTWSSLGPSTSNSGYSGIGRVNCLAFHPTDANTIWVGTPAGGLWKTTNGGSTWSTNSDEFPSLGVSAIAIHPKTPTTMYLGTGDGDAYDTYFYGILKSTDGGTTWTNTAVPGYEPYVARKIIINPINPSIVIIATDRGVYRSTNDGVSWIMTIPGNMYDLEFKPNDPNTVYATSRTEIFKSINGGDTWTSSMVIATSNRIALAVTPANPALVMALSSASATNGFNGVYTSTNSGTSFSTTATTPNLLGWEKDGSDMYGQGYYDLCIAIAPNDAKTVFVGGVNLWKSTNGGVSWTPNNLWWNEGSVPTVHADKHHLEFQNNTTLFQACDGGVYKTTNGGTNWTDLSNGLVISQMYKLGTAQTSDAVMTGLQDNSSKAKLPGRSWVDIAGTGDGMEGAIDPTNDKIQYTESYYGDILRIGLNATYQKTSEKWITPPNQSGAWVTPFVLDPSDPATIYAGYYDIFKSTDRGDNWTKISNNLSPSDMTNIAVAPSNSNYIYTSSRLTFYRTLDGGTTWETLEQPTVDNDWISHIAVNPTDAATIYMTISSYVKGEKVYKSTDAGTTWTNISGTLPALPVHCITYQKGSNEGLYIGTDVGIFYKNATMTDWIPFKNGLPNVIVAELEINYLTNKILAATYGRGLWQSDLFLTEPPMCSVPSNISTNGSFATTATLVWTGSALATTYSLQYRAVGSETWITIPNLTTNSAQITGLTPSTQYECQIKSNCSDKTATAFSAIANFSTSALVPCPVPTNLSAYTNTIEGYTQLYWNGSAEALDYTVQYRVVGSTAPWTSAKAPVRTAQTPIDPRLINKPIARTLGTETIAANDWSITYTGRDYYILSKGVLLPATEYEFRIVMNCSANASEASEVKTFRTPEPPCSNPKNLRLGGSFANGAWVTWDELYGPGANVLYKKTTDATWTPLSTMLNRSEFGNLTPATTYQVKVRTRCEDDGLPNATQNTAYQEISFTTPACLLSLCSTSTGRF